MRLINKEIKELWEKTPNEKLNGLMPSFYPELVSDSIMFIGINPSFSKKGFKKILSNTEYESLDVDSFYSYPNKGEFDIEKSIKIEKLALLKYPYFSKFGEVSKYVNVPWTHLDLFFLRETSQKNIYQYIYKKKVLNSFGRSQLDISKKIIEKSCPKLIIVANALASKIFFEYFNLEFNNKDGCYDLFISERIVPVFLTSMLTGQRALDNFSFQRLCWHVKKVNNERFS